MVYEKINNSKNKPNLAAFLIESGRKYPFYHIYIAIKENYSQQDLIADTLKKYPFYTVQTAIVFFNIIIKNGMGKQFFTFLHHLIPTISYMYYSDAFILIPEFCGKIAPYFDTKEEGKFEFDWIATFDTAFLRVYNNSQQFCEFPAQSFIANTSASTPLTSLLLAILEFVVPHSYASQDTLIERLTSFTLSKPNKQCLNQAKSKKPLKTAISFILSLISIGSAPKWILDVANIKGVKGDELTKHYVVAAALKRVYEACTKQNWEISNDLRTTIV